MRAVIVGAVESTRITLRALANAPGWDVAALVTLPPELSQRHSDFVDMTADAHNAQAKTILAANSNTPEVIAGILACSADYVFVIGWSQICGTAFRSAFNGRVIGYHPAPLPRLRGRAIIPWTILLDEKITASTLFWIDGGVDSGPILSQHYFHVAADETAASLYARHMEALEQMLSISLPELQNSTAPKVIQDDRFATWAAKRTPEDGLIDWSQPADHVWRLIRAVGRPYPGAFTYMGDDRVVIWSANLWPDAVRHAALPGQVIMLDDYGFAVTCGDGRAVQVTEYASPTGRKPKMHSHLGRRHAL